MKKKLAILAMAGVMLFSGLNVYAATNVCSHPVTYETYRDDMYIANLTKCNEHNNCQVGDGYQTKVTLCYFCRKELNAQIVGVGKRHVTK